MRSSLRCKAHHQGDRCVKYKDHDSDFVMEPDKVHVGSFAAWEDRGMVAQLKNSAPRRAEIRRIDKALRHVERNPMAKHARYVLEQVMARLGGSK